LINELKIYYDEKCFGFFPIVVLLKLGKNIRNKTPGVNRNM